MLQEYTTKGITLRNDNGSQFITHAVRNYLQERDITQQFTHVATPEENCSIEAYHSILDKQLLQTTEFQDIEEAIAVFSRWRTFYNERRRKKGRTDASRFFPSKLFFFPIPPKTHRKSLTVF